MSPVQPLLPARPVTPGLWVLGVLLASAYTLAMYFQQSVLPISDNTWDGHYYYRMALGETFYAPVLFPLWLRIGLPWVAARFPTADVMLNFMLINTVAAILYLLLCYWLLVRCSRGMSLWVPVLGWWLLCASNLSPVPGVFWYPVQTDALSCLLSLVFLSMVITGRLPLLVVALLFCVGTLVRENFPEFLLYGLLRFRFAAGDSPRGLPWCQQQLAINRGMVNVLLAGLCGSAAGLWGIYLYTGHSPVESKIGMMLWVLSTYFGKPSQFLSIIANSVSPLLLFWMAGRIARCQLSGQALVHVPMIRWVIGIFSFIALTGGTNPERYWYWTMPLFVLCLLPLLQAMLQRRAYLLVMAGMCWATVIQRSLVPIQAQGVLQPCGVVDVLLGRSNWMGHWADQCDVVSQVGLVLLMLWVFVAVALLARLYRPPSAGTV